MHNKKFKLSFKANSGKCPCNTSINPLIYSNNTLYDVSSKINKSNILHVYGPPYVAINYNNLNNAKIAAG